MKENYIKQKLLYMKQEHAKKMILYNLDIYLKKKEIKCKNLEISKLMKS